MKRRDLDTPTTIFIKAQDGLCYTESSPEEADAYIDPYGEIRNAAEASHPAGFRPMRLVNIGERVPVGIDDAIARMAEGPRIPVAIESAPGVVLSAHWRRKKVIAFIKKNGVEEAGPKSTRHGFGLASTDGTKWYFIATQRAATPEAEGQASAEPIDILQAGTLLPPPPGVCPKCAVDHHPELPHDQTSLYWQYAFRKEHGRWPTWRDAMAHCTEDTRAMWEKVMGEKGIKID